MATLTNPINPQNIIDRFNDYVVTTANTGISWGTNAVPFTEMSTAYFGGTTSGKEITTMGTNIGDVGSTITAADIYDTLVAETNTYTRIRMLNAQLFVQGGGGNTGSRPTPGTVYNNTAVANLNTGYLQSIGSPSNVGVASGQPITNAGLEGLFDNLRNSYNSARATAAQIVISVCHSSCHSSCHGSRGRR